MDLSIIIVNWNSAGYLKACLTSIFKTVSGLSFEVIVIDGGSNDGCAAMIQQGFPVVRFIQAKGNPGFPKANNAAYAQAKGDAILFLNPDTEVGDKAVFNLWQSLQQEPRAGIAGAKLLNTDGTVQTSCIQSFPTILNQAFDCELLRQCFPKAALWGMADLYNSDTKPKEVDLVSGACLMVKREVFERVGHFSTYCFMYVEDVDLCYKTRQAGWKTCYVPTAVVTHHGGGSSTRSVKTFGVVMAQESLRRFFEHTRGRLYARAYTITLALAAAQRCLLLACALTVQSIAGAGQQSRFSLNKWFAILRWTLGQEKWVKKYG
jgi:N-acetylglucosaminyl-diphospho-decaprenol L-rhamnosyltransferase